MTVYLERRLENPIVHEGVRPKEPQRKEEPFIAWEILQEAGLSQLWDIPAEDVEVAKTAIVLDGFAQKLSLHEKRRILAFRLWYLDGNFGRIKKYLGENKGPSLDALVSSAWDQSKISNRFEEVQEVLGLMNKLMTRKNITNIVRYMFVYRKFRQLEAKGLEDDEIIAREEEILTSMESGTDRLEYRFLQAKKRGLTIDEIAKYLSNKQENIFKIQNKFISEGILTIPTIS